MTKIEKIRVRQAELAGQIATYKANAAKLGDELSAIQNATRTGDEQAKSAAQPKVDGLTAQIMAELDASTPLMLEAEALEKEAREIAFQLKGIDMQIARTNSELMPIISQLHSARQEVERIETAKEQVERQIEGLKSQRNQIAPAHYKPL